MKREVAWYNGYDQLPPIPEKQNTDTIVIFGLENIIKHFLSTNSPRLQFKQWLDSWLQWEQTTRNKTLFLIGADIGKGIVPMEKEERAWRDMTGWCYQDVVKEAERVDVIWYGLNHRLK
ncbi:bifunctional adenosylcobinamide kinase/adenosylcobinamide-phosphate guanylyltransferase [Halalkalibacter urbisdiaboli]|uniref:bifunctional adenosylcobinamide kinase/adenosylcobinamide-phosphate guanylyltransferase n=1 Tax=Halalkalibacter urbisdiaboli TaxID=1960589 RepID=UPI0013FE22E4|nr:bifunctional adenosylcobinamide kinase/adenosylcobinamide-phosphate guanylyltransferase [Halalkalibacter urbisdiaboli]